MENKTVPYVVYEGSQARNERTTRRLIIALIIVTIMMFVSNIVWLWAWMQYDYVAEDSSVSVDAQDGIANYIGERGNINYGTDFSTQENENTD